MKELTMNEIEQVSGGVSNDAAYGASVGVAGGLLALGLTVTAPVWGTAALLGGSIFASAMAIQYAMK
ncbi:hypothetical protein [Microbulbifer spongiae]|uniref:Bacteriocin n=1 Tax=Microbulbifer spongiae TaxID=2944933 RepID=A0ABY9EC97_9GAMM|nr:hypothetical protein [Microbulbifer sp. MI-G]WKD48396.1 hypothetical protein M8T91_10675 [Microbulbifer sp. MI-G]